MIKTTKSKFIGLSLLLVGVAVNAQDANEAKKAIDAEQYQKAKTSLKSLIASKPEDGKNYFLLGDVYLTQTVQDSAALYFNKGKAAKDNAEYNNIGLGQIDLNAGNVPAAQAKFDAVEKDLKKKDVEQLVYIGRAYIYAEKPDYKKAIAVLTKAVAKDNKYAPAYLNLGEAQYRDRNQNEAYKNFRTASELDPSLLRAKLQLGVITKNTRAAFPEAVKAFDAIVAANPNYGPVYRELAETYYLWGNTNSAKKTEYNAKALGYYEKYMGLTDYSLDSRLRHADFLLLTGDYKALEAEAQKMQQMDKVNPRILRYAAYSAYENGNYEGSLTSMKEFIAKVEPKRVIARDYLYLGLAQLATTVGKDAKDNSIIKDQAKFDEAIGNIKKAAETDITITNEFNEIGKKLFTQKLYGPASVVFEVAAANPENKNLFYDNFYLAYSIYYDHVNKSDADKKNNAAQLKKADVALNKVIELSPDAQDAYLFKARVNQNLQTNEAYAAMGKAYDEYIKIVTAKGAAETSKEAVSKNLIEAYSNAGAYYAVTDKAKAKEYFTKAIALNPNDQYAKAELKKLN
jgi:tetratricopeptide (TPR) repeat protein